MAPKPADILDAECRVALARNGALNSLHRVRSSVRAGLAQPSTLAVTAGLAGLAGFLLAWRGAAPRVPQVPRFSIGKFSFGKSRAAETTAKTGAAGAAAVISAYLIRWGQRRLMSHLYGMWTDMRRRPAGQRARTLPPYRTS